MVWTLLVAFLTGVITFATGVVFGISLSRIEKKVENIKDRLTRSQKRPESGPIRPYTQDEKEDLDNLEHKRMKELL